MALQTSGAISFSDLQNEYGGANPISLSEYYKNGSYVPSSITVSNEVREPLSGDYYSRSIPYYYMVYSYSTNQTKILWNGSTIATVSGAITSYTSGSYTYYRGTFRVTETVYPPPPMPREDHDYYGVYRTSGSSSTETLNENVPTSGIISLSNFYGGRKT